MPNLLPDWLPWIRPAGRLIWGCLALVVGLMFVVALLRRPMLKRPFPDRVGYAGFFVILAVGVFAARILTDYQTWVVWVTVAALVGLGLVMVATSKGRDAEDPATWAECFAGAVGVFALFVVGFAIIPSEWLNYANGYLNWGDTTKFVWTSHQQMLFLPFELAVQLRLPVDARHRRGPHLRRDAQPGPQALGDVAATPRGEGSAGRRRGRAGAAFALRAARSGPRLGDRRWLVPTRTRRCRSS